MAGFVQIKDETGFPMATMTFNAIAELSRKNIETIGQGVYEKVYETLDQGGLDILTLDALDKNEYMLCVKSIEASYANCLAAKRCGDLDAAYYASVMSTWDEFVGFLKKDSRYQEA